MLRIMFIAASLLSMASMKIRTRIESDRGATAVEYGLLVALIAAVIVGFVVTLGDEVGSAFDCVGQSIANGSDECTGG